MALDRKTVAHVARLARLRVPEEDLDRLAKELSQILSWVEQLAEVDTKNVAPVASVVASELPQRADVVTDGFYADKVLANAPAPLGAFFTVPKVVE